MHLTPNRSAPRDITINEVGTRRWTRVGEMDQAVARGIITQPLGQTQSRRIGDDHDADIVFRAERDRALDQHVGGSFHRMIAQYGGNIRIRERPAQPIGAQQQSVAGHEMVPAFFKSEPVPRSQKVRDDIGEGMVGGCFGPNFTAVDEVLDIAVIVADLLQSAGPQQIAAAVAGP